MVRNPTGSCNADAADTERNPAPDTHTKSHLYFAAKVRDSIGETSEGGGMKGIVAGFNHILFAVVAMVSLQRDAHAQLGMPQRESIQTVVWVVEFATFIVILAAVWFVWRISKKASENKKTGQDNP
jgi:hypothetical protein